MTKNTETNSENLVPEVLDDTAKRTTPETTLDIGGGTEGNHQDNLTAVTGENKDCDADSKLEFESLIKGKFKKEFAGKVQEIINKRFKENKTKELEKAYTPKAEEKEPDPQKANSAKETDNSKLVAEAAELIAMGYKDFNLEKELLNPTFKALITGGVDMQTAYKALHFDEIMDGSVAYGATLAAKQMADSIRFKVGRPTENGLSQRVGYAPHSGAAGLTPEKRRELAKKALMGDQISF